MKKWLKFRKEYLNGLKNHEGYYVCILCKKWVKYPELHHVKKRSTNPELILDPKNIMILCQDCHLEVNPDYKKPLQKNVERGIIL